MKKAPSQGNRTQARQFRLADDTLAILDGIAAHYGFKGRADAIRVAARNEAQRIGLMIPDVAKKKRGKTSE